MVNVTKKNFIEQSNDLLKHLPDASFIAIDEEMTGIRSGRLAKDDTPSQRYLCLREVPQTYAIIQVGICLFTKNPAFRNQEINVEAEYLVRRYNFYLFPPTGDDAAETTREVTMNPSSIAFLNQHSMDFNLWTSEGIPYVTTQQAATLVERYKTEKLKKDASSSTNTPARDPTRRRITLTRQDDVNFHARAMASLREWIDSSIRGQPSLLLPACNRFMRRALYESIELEYPALILENGGPPNQNRILVWRLSPQEKEVRKQRLAKEAWEKLVMNVGFQRVFQALSQVNQGFCPSTTLVIMAESVDKVDMNANDSSSLKPLGRKIPIICHNGLMDLLFLFTHFHSHTLPDSYVETKALIHSTFPLIYDTKILATECSDQNSIGDSTILGTLYSKFVEDDVTFDEEGHFEIINSSGSDADQMHEASYDAFMTGALFVALSKRILRDESQLNNTSLSDILSQSQYEDVTKNLLGRNKLYLMLTMYTIDLENPNNDTFRHGLSSRHTFRVTGPSISIISNSDIIASLSHRIGGDNVRFEIVWVDSTTFMVATKSFDGQETLERHGALILAALKRRFAQEEIITLQDYLDLTKRASNAEEEEQEEEKQANGGGLWSRFIGMFGSKRKSESDESEGEPSAKRRRTA